MRQTVDDKGMRTHFIFFNEEIVMNIRNDHFMNQQATDHHFYTAHESVSLRNIHIFIRKKNI